MKLNKLRKDEAIERVNLYKKSWLVKNREPVFEDWFCRSCRHNRMPPVWCKRYCSLC